MAEFEIDVVTPDGKMGSFVAHPDGKGPFPAVILYMDAPGIREELRDFARRIASQGYFCLLPDMYYRNGQLRFDFSMDRDNVFKLVMATCSSERLPLVCQSMPSAVYSLACQPTPMPSRSRPPDNTSTSADCLATSTAWRCGRIRMPVASPTRLVQAAMKP